MTPIIPTVSALAVSAIFCVWQAYIRQDFRSRQLLLRERVAYMLWVAASLEEEMRDE